MTLHHISHFLFLPNSMLQSPFGGTEVMVATLVLLIVYRRPVFTILFRGQGPAAPLTGEK